MMTKPKRNTTVKKVEPPDALFGRVVSILEQARGNVVRAVNSNMVLAYWLIGREIVEALQGGQQRAAYGKKVVEELSARLTERYVKGYSVSNLWYFRQFHLAFQDRLQILHPAGGESAPPLIEQEIPYPVGTKSGKTQILRPLGIESARPQKSSPKQRQQSNPVAMQLGSRINV